MAISEITEAADVGFGSFYYHFESKDGVFAALTEWVFDDFADGPSVSRAACRIPPRSCPYACATLRAVAPMGPLSDAGGLFGARSRSEDWASV